MSKLDLIAAVIVVGGIAAYSLYSFAMFVYELPV